MSTDGLRSRPSKNNRHADAQGGERPRFEYQPGDLPGETGLRQLSVEDGRRLREEAVHEHSDKTRARPWWAVLNEWRDWYEGYRNSHIEFQDPDGETVRTQLQNSYMPEYGGRYYAKLKDLERGIERGYESLTTAMLTFSASTRNANGGPRCPGDHMRDIAEGWATARKRLHKALSGVRWEYAKVWEPHQGGEGGTGGYGHMHVAVFVEDDQLEAGTFEPVMNSYVDNCAPAASEAHDLGTAVSVRSDVNNLGSYISEYIGIFGDETLERPIHEQMFYSVTWATNTRRVEFSNGAQDIIGGEQFRRETGLRPEDRGAVEEPTEGEPSGWSAESICRVEYQAPEYHDPTSGGVETVPIDGSTGVDPPPVRE